MISTDEGALSLRECALCMADRQREERWGTRTKAASGITLFRTTGVADRHAAPL